MLQSKMSDKIYHPTFFFTRNQTFNRYARTLRRICTKRTETFMLNRFSKSPYTQQELDEVEQNIVICRWRANQITDKSRYYVITEVNNYFIIRSPSLFSYLNHSLTAQGSDLPLIESLSTDVFEPRTSTGSFCSSFSTFSCLTNKLPSSHFSIYDL